MSSILISNIDSNVKESQIKWIFKEFGSINNIEFSNNEKDDIKNAKVFYKNKNSAIKACILDGREINSHKIKVCILRNNKPVQKPKTLFTFNEIMLILLVLLISFFLHFPIKFYPNEVVYDESKTGIIINDYIKGKRLFDTNPPLSYLILSFYAKNYCSYNGTFEFNESQEYDNSIMNIQKLRTLPCICGTLVAPIITASLLLRHCSILSSFLAGLLLSFDFVSIVESRFIFITPISYLFLSLTIFFSCLLTRYNNIFVVFLQSLFASCAFSSKFSTFSAFIYVVIVNIKLVRDKGLLLRLFLIILVFSSVFIMCFWYHLISTPEIGNGDRYLPRD